MSTPKKAAAAVVDLVNRVGIEEATALMVKLAAEREAALSTPTTEEARELAKRWAHKCDGPLSGSTFRACECWQILDTADEERLYAWVREWMERKRMSNDIEADLGEVLGLEVEDAHALADAVKAGSS